MVRGLTDKESLEVTMRGSRERKRLLARLKELAAKGSNDPEHLTPEETRELCASVLREFDQRES